MKTKKMSGWIKLEKRARRGLTDECSVTSTCIAIGTKYARRLKSVRSVDVYSNNLRSVIGIVPRGDDEGYASRIRGPGVAYVGTKNMIRQLNVVPGRYPAKWTAEELDGEEKTILLIDVRAKSTIKKKQ